ncbi:hypothetical protein [Paractinoplanes durhamensis]|uniref:hypothetical protein n=1 Tax=Paractinoplanes durhamensis TaxID=113563 RepID=UPI001940A4F9|nr:hypothetical protein [Actinoplanes durhamensis]
MTTGPELRHHVAQRRHLLRHRGRGRTLSSWRNNQPTFLTGGGSYSSNVGTVWNDTADSVEG